MKNVKFIFILLLIGIIVGIFNCNLPDNNFNMSEENQSNSKVNQDSDRKKIGFTYIEGKPAKISYETIDGIHIYQGDIVVPDHLLFHTKEDAVKYLSGNGNIQKAAVVVSRIWPNNSVNYSIASNVYNRDVITNAIANIENNTSIDFIENASGNYIEFIPASYSASIIGMSGGKQNIWLAEWSSTGTVMHEICHALGLYHEHCRKDRDNYVIIKWENIENGEEYNFDKISSSNDMDIDVFDFNSIMLYSSYGFSSNGQPTITKLDGSTYTINRSYLSTGDLAGIDYLYPNNLNAFNIPGKIEAENYSDMNGIDTEPCSEGTLNVGWIDVGDWLDYHVYITKNTDYEVTFRIANLYSTGKIDFLIDGNKLKTINVPNTGEWQNWTSISEIFNLSSGYHTIKLYASGSPWNLNWIDFSELDQSSSSSSSSISSSSSSSSSISSSSSSSSTGGIIVLTSSDKNTNLNINGEATFQIPTEHNGIIQIQKPWQSNIQISINGSAFQPTAFDWGGEFSAAPNSTVLLTVQSPLSLNIQLNWW